MEAVNAFADKRSRVGKVGGEEDEEFAFSVQNQPGCYFRKQNLCSENLTVVLHSDMRISLNDMACYAT